MKKLVFIIFIIISVKAFAQENTDIQILNILLAPSIDLSADSIYDEKGVPKKMYESLFYNQVIINTTSVISKQNNDYKQLLSKGLNKLEQSTYLDFENKNSQSIKIDSLKIKNRKIILIEKPKAEKIIARNKWSKFQKDYPNAKPVIMSISKIGYNKNKTQALLYTTNNNSFGGNYGFYILYIFKEGNWKINQSIMVAL